VSIVTGDFNISGADMRLYPEIRRALDPLGFHDIWAWDVFGHNPSQGLTCRFTDGEESAWDRTFNAVCEYRNQEGMRGAWREYCDDDVIHPTPQRGVGRYDYVFIERPMRAHKYTLEIVRPIRRSFPRREATDKEDYLSDHLGIDLTFLCTRK
jgi:pimeloyl-ACP methyl ester carboxylesterase